MTAARVSALLALRYIALVVTGNAQLHPLPRHHHFSLGHVARPATEPTLRAKGVRVALAARVEALLHVDRVVHTASFPYFSLLAAALVRPPRR